MSVKDLPTLSQEMQAMTITNNNHKNHKDMSKHSLAGVVLAMGVVCLPRHLLLHHRLGHLNRQEQCQEVSDAKATAARPHGLDSAILVRLRKAHTLQPIQITGHEYSNVIKQRPHAIFLPKAYLNEFKEGGLVSRIALEHRRREDLKKHILTLDIDQHLVAHNLQVRRLVQAVAQHLEHVHVPGRAHNTRHVIQFLRELVFQVCSNVLSNAGDLFVCVMNDGKSGRIVVQNFVHKKL